MRSLQRTIIPLLLLSFVVVSLGAYSPGSRALLHQLDHERHLFGLSGEHAHQLAPKADDLAKPQPLSDLEHRLLHALSHFEPVLDASVPMPAPLHADIIPSPPRPLSLPPRVAESPFRPPRGLLQS